MSSGFGQFVAIDDFEVSAKGNGYTFTYKDSSMNFDADDYNVEPINLNSKQKESFNKFKEFAEERWGKKP